jgi:hypothetical protein
MNQASMFPTVPCPKMTSRDLVTQSEPMFRVSSMVPSVGVWAEELPTRPGDSILCVLQGAS